MPQRSNPVLAIPVSFFIVFLLTALPLPQVLAYWRPEWVAMVLVFWVLNEPEWVGVWVAFFLGILLDALLGTVFGLHPLMLAVVAYLTRLSYRWVRVFSIWQTGGLIFGLVLVSLLVKFLVLSVQGHPPVSVMYWVPALSSALVWPTVMLSLRRWNRRF